jgi:hypothetical protein
MCDFKKMELSDLLDKPFINESYLNYHEAYVASKFETRIYKTQKQVDQHPLL